MGNPKPRETLAQCKKSAAVYAASGGKAWWSLMISAVGAVGGVMTVTDKVTVLPLWVWLVVAFIGAVVAPFWAFHKYRISTEERESKTKTLHNAQVDSMKEQIEDSKRLQSEKSKRLRSLLSQGHVLYQKRSDNFPNRENGWIEEYKSWHGMTTKALQEECCPSEATGFAAATGLSIPIEKIKVGHYGAVCDKPIREQLAYLRGVVDRIDQMPTVS